MRGRWRPAFATLVAVLLSVRVAAAVEPAAAPVPGTGADDAAAPTEPDPPAAAAVTDADASPPTTDGADGNGSDRVPAIAAADVAAVAPVALYDRQAALYRGALEVARALAVSRGADPASAVELTGLRPPHRPRLRLPLDGAPRLGRDGAPVTVVAVEGIHLVVRSAQPDPVHTPHDVAEPDPGG